MGWLSDWWYKDDPRAAIEVDKSLEDYLKTQSPGSYKPTSEEGTGSTTQQKTYREQVGFKRVPEAPRDKRAQQAQASAEKQALGDDEDEQKPLPAESLFQDGRYKDLWATYRPQAEIDEEMKTDQERLSDIARGWRQRASDITRAAAENCVEESMAVHNCFRNGGWKSRMTMCRDENKSLTRCIAVQRQFLGALGYLTIWDRTDAESEQIQAHADKLYQEMLRQEKLIKEAKAKGEEVPTFEPLVDPNKKYKPGHKISFDELPEDTKQMLLDKRLKNLEGPALELGKRAVEADIERHADAVWQIDDHHQLNRRHREERYFEGTESMGDKLRRWYDTNYLDRPFPKRSDPQTEQQQQEK